jgi:hypothetical protein
MSEASQRDGESVVGRAAAAWTGLDRGWRAAALGLALVAGHALV